MYSSCFRSKKLCKSISAEKKRLSKKAKQKISTLQLSNKKGYNTDKLNILFFESCGQNNAAMVKQLLKKHRDIIDINRINLVPVFLGVGTPNGNLGFNPLTMTAHINDLEVLDLLLKEDKIDINFQIQGGRDFGKNIFGVADFLIVF
jgi:hypothetical protein|tara:strand:- start:943 stop:1383 length:441 start_codon:yes stop_codon:yes gene_type:complete